MDFQIDTLRRGLQIRRAEELLLEAFKDGHIRGTVHTCIGQELIPVLVSEFFGDALWFSNHRGHGHYLARTRDFEGLFAEILGREGGVSGGVGGSQHLFADGFISNGIQGGQAGIAAGFASPRSSKINESVMFIGDGTLGAGHLYEAWNIAAVEKSGVLYIVEDNKIAQSTPSAKVFMGNLEDRVSGFGLQYFFSEDNELDFLRKALESAKFKIENQIPTLLHIGTKRLGPHSKGDDNRDPKVVESLRDTDLISQAVLQGLISYSDDEVREVEDIFKEVLNRQPAKYVNQTRILDLWDSKHVHGAQDSKNLQEHINKSLHRMAKENSNLLFIGEDISDDQYEIGARYGGAFKVSSGLSTHYPSRVFSTPISESGLTGYGIGLALASNPVIIEIMFGDFLTQNYDQIVHQMSKIPTMYGRAIPLPIVLRTAVGGGRGYGPTHSAYMDNILIGLPNIIVVSLNCFSNYYQIIRWGLSNKVPMIILEPKILYAQEYFPRLYSEYQLSTGDFKGFHHIVPKNASPNFLFITHGGVSDIVLKSLQALAEQEEIFSEILILELISPLDAKAILNIIERCGKKIVLVEESMNGFGAGAYLLSRLLAEGLTPSLLHLYLRDWHPSGVLEDQALFDANEIKERILEWIDSGK